MDRFSRTVLGYHGCRTPESIAFAKQLLAREAEVSDWRPSTNDFDCLGSGICFWEFSPERARRWTDDEGIVIGAVIQLGQCLDLTDLRYTEFLERTFQDLAESHEKTGKALPENRGREQKARYLDCLVINTLVDDVAKLASTEGQFHTVRGAFEEGEPAFPGSMIRKETHIQIAVLDTDCILGVFLPNLS